jgi:hypothetical protein
MDTNRHDLFLAMARFDQEFRDTEEWSRWEQNKAHRYAIRHDEKLYPVKQIVSLATGVPVTERTDGIDGAYRDEVRG